MYHRTIIAIGVVVAWLSCSFVRADAPTEDTVWDMDANALVGELVAGVNERIYALLRSATNDAEGARIETYWIDPIPTVVYEVAWHPDGHTETMEVVHGSATQSVRVLSFEYAEGDEPEDYKWVPKDLAGLREALAFGGWPYITGYRDVLFRPVTNQFLATTFLVESNFVSRIDFKKEVLAAIGKLIESGAYLDTSGSVPDLLHEEIGPLIGWIYPEPYYHLYFAWAGSGELEICQDVPCPGTTVNDYTYTEDFGGAHGFAWFQLTTPNTEAVTGSSRRRRVQTQPPDRYFDGNPMGPAGRVTYWTNTIVWSGPAVHLVQTNYAITNFSTGTYPSPIAMLPVTNPLVTSTNTGLIPVASVYYRATSNWIDEDTLVEHRAYRPVMQHHEVIFNAREALTDAFTTDELVAPRFYIRYWPASEEETNFDLDIDLSVSFNATGLGHTNVNITWEDEQAKRWFWHSVTRTGSVDLLNYLSNDPTALPIDGFRLNQLFFTNTAEIVLSKFFSPAPWPKFPANSHWTIYGLRLPDLHKISTNSHHAVADSPYPDQDPSWIVPAWRLVSQMQRTRMSSYSYLPGHVHDGTQYVGKIERKVDTVGGSTDVSYSLIDPREDLGATSKALSSLADAIPGSWEFTALYKRNHVIYADQVDSDWTENIKIVDMGLRVNKSTNVAGTVRSFIMRRKDAGNNFVYAHAPDNGPFAFDFSAGYEPTEDSVVLLDTAPALISDIAVDLEWETPHPQTEKVYSASAGSTSVTRSRIEENFFFDVIWDWDFEHPTAP